MGGRGQSSRLCPRSWSPCSGLPAQDELAAWPSVVLRQCILIQGCGHALCPLASSILLPSPSSPHPLPTPHSHLMLFYKSIALRDLICSSHSQGRGTGWGHLSVHREGSSPCLSPLASTERLGQTLNSTWWFESLALRSARNYFQHEEIFTDEKLVGGAAGLWTVF